MKLGPAGVMGWLVGKVIWPIPYKIENGMNTSLSRSKRDPGNTGGIDPLSYPVPFPITSIPFSVPFPKLSIPFLFNYKYRTNVEIRTDGNGIFSVRFHPCWWEWEAVWWKCNG